MLTSRRKLLNWSVGIVVGAAALAVVWFLQRGETSADSKIPSEQFTFGRDVAPIIFSKCASCHHPGDAAPFSLLSYEDVKSRAGQIAEVTHSRFMPPWLPSEGHGEFEGARRLNDRELLILKQWADSGAPRGDTELPTTPVFSDDWKAGPPDLVLESPAYTLASQDRDVFRNFVVPVKLDGPRWIQSIELRPENPRVTHHARLGVDSSNESSRRDAEDPEPGYAGMAWGQDPDGHLVIWAPGLVARPGTPGIAWRLHPQSCLVLHTHMQPSGKPEVVKFRIGIRFAPEPPRQHPVILRVGSCDIDIPAGARRHVVTDNYTLPIDVDVHTIFPHAHSLCRELLVEAEKPDGSKELLISISQFDENWHDVYRYRAPVRLPRGTRLHTTFVYDNSSDNPRNRNRPPRRVVYGSHVTDEMGDVYLQMTAVRADQRAVLMEHYKQYELQAQIAGHRKSLELEPGNPWSQEALAANYLGAGKLPEAIALLEQRLKKGPNAVFPVVSLGLALAARGDAVRAEAELRRAIAMDSQYPLAWFGLGKALAAQKKSEPAEAAFRKAAELAPGSLDAHLSLAGILMQRGDLTKAAEVCAAVLNDSPEMAAVHMKLAEIRAKQKNYDECLEHCRAAQRLAPYTHPPKVLLAIFCHANGDSDRSLKLLQEARAESPDHPMPPLVLGQMARRREDFTASREFLTDSAARPIPDNWPDSHRKRFLILLHSERFQLARQLKDLAMARDAISQWLSAEPGNQQLLKMHFQVLAGTIP